MMIGFIAFLGLLPLTAATFTRPSFCRTYECPKYTVVQKFDQAELRCYSPAKWASTTISGTDLLNAGALFFRRLYGYRRAQNKEKVSIPMTVPVTIKTNACRGMSCPRKYTYSVYLPEAFQKSPPVPINAHVTVSLRPRMCVYVRSFPGFAPESEIRNQARLLRRYLLAQKGISDFKVDSYYFAGYDGPFRKKGRHNEIWFMKY